jgi:hypothetical protein
MAFGRELQRLLEENPEVALAYVRGMPPGAAHTQGVLMVLGTLGRTDPDRALSLAREMVTTRDQRSLYNTLFAEFVAADPQVAVRRLEQVPAGEGRDNALRALADGWAKSDLPAALEWAGGLTAADRGPAMEAVLTALASTDPLRAIDLARQSLPAAAFERTLGAAMQQLVRADPTAAAALVGKLSPGAAQTQAALQIARTLSERNPAEALTWAKTLPEELRSMSTGNILEVWAGKDPVAAGQYVAQMPAGSMQDEATLRLARILAANPMQAIVWAQTLPNDSARRVAQVNLASAWAARDPAAATQWAASLGAGETRTTALNGALSYWAAADAAAARNFVFGLTGDTQVGAAAHLAPTLAQRDPVAAIAWTQTLPAQASDAALLAAYARWVRNAPAAAQAWLAGANLPAATKARLTGQP